MGTRAIKGRFAFEYDRVLSETDFHWLSKFDVFVPGHIISPELVRKYREAGTQLFFYEWALGFYNSQTRHDPWLAEVFDNHPDWLLDPGTEMRFGSHNLLCWYYDLGNPEFRKAWAGQLALKLRESGYAGIFFDCLPSKNVHPREELRQLFASRHPGQTYAGAFGTLLACLREEIAGAKIFTNQGYRVPDKLLPCADFDLSESYMTTHDNSRLFVSAGERGRLTNIRPWWDERQRWKSTKHIVGHCIGESVAGVCNSLEIMHLNYACPLPGPDGTPLPDREAIHYAFAAARLFGHNAYVQHQNKEGHPELDHDDIYFVDLGKPLVPMRELGDKAACRVFERGIAVVNGTGKKISVDLPAAGTWRNTFTGELTTGPALMVPANVQADGIVAPAGRVFVRV